MLSHVARPYVAKLPDRLVKDGKVNLKYLDFETHAAVQDEGIVSALIATLLDDLVTQEIKDKYFNLFITKGQ